MRLLEITLDGIRSYHEPQTIDLTNVRCSSIVGKNGACKSTILTGIVYALFGLARGADELLSHDAQRGEVTVTFQIDGERYKVARGRERGKKPWLSLARRQADGWATVPSHTISETQARLTEILGMTEDVFTASVFSPQGQAGRLIAMSPGQRKQLLGELLGLDVYEQYRLQFALEVRSLDQTLAVAEDRIERLAQEIEQITAQETVHSLVDVAELLGLARTEAQRWTAELDGALQRETDRERWLQRQQLTRQINLVVEQGKQLKARRGALATRRAALLDLKPLEQALADAEAARNAELKRVAAGQGAEKAARAQANQAHTALQRAVDDRHTAERALV